MKKSSLKDGRIIKSYSESFRQKVLREISEGKLTKNGAQRKYGISVGSIYFWIKKYQRTDLYNPRIRIEMPNERDQQKALRSENKKLKEALVQLQLQRLKSEADFAIAIEELGYSDTEEYKKKLKANPSKKL
jgi:transposase-like protein